MADDLSGIEIALPTDGRCMRPWIWPGGMLHVRRCGIRELSIGDIAVWFDGGRMQSHRVVELGDDYAITRGDLLETKDAPIRREQIVGKAVRFSMGGLAYSVDGPVLTLLGRLVAAVSPPAVRAVKRLKARARRWSTK